MKKTAFLLIILAFSFHSYAQTEKIAHRSHSGKDKTFRVTGYNNWGETPEMRAERLKRDSIMKAKADSIANKKRIDSVAKQTTQKPKRNKLVKKQ
ncbi:MAG: hypothetical protein ABI685_12485 [Ferruginibacter sp.]